MNLIICPNENNSRTEGVQFFVGMLVAVKIALSVLFVVHNLCFPSRSVWPTILFISLIISETVIGWFVMVKFKCSIIGTNCTDNLIVSYYSAAAAERKRLQNKKVVSQKKEFRRNRTSWD
jgi:hypothetical protein